MEHSSHFFNSGPFMPHGGCYLWTTSLIALHAISDSLIFFAYYSIPVTLFYFVRKRTDLKFHWMFICFAVFILACGTTHIMEVWNIWHANYWVSGIIKAITALASVPTAILLVKLMPQALALPSPDALRRAYGELEERVAERTAELKTTNEILLREARERQRSEEQLTILLKELSDFKAALDEHAIVAITDPSGKITYVNDKFCAISKYSREELIGQDHRIINSGHHPKEFIGNLWATIGKGIVWRGEIKNRAKDGSYYWVDTTIVPFIGENGKPRQYVAIRADITGRKQIEEEREKLAQLVAHSRDFISVTDLQGHVAFINNGARMMIGLTPASDVSSLRSADYVHPDWQGFFNNTVIATALDQGIWEGEMKFRHLTAGAAIDIFRSTFLLRDAAGQPIGFATVARDITESKRTQAEILKLNAELEQRVARRTAELEAANKELEAFSYSVSHDLRAPLRSISGFAGIVLEDFGPQLPEEGRNYLERVRNGGQRMGALIDDLLAFSRLSRQAVNRQTVNPARQVQEALEELKPQRDGREIEIRIGELPMFQADPALFKQVWLNLLSNAIKYTRDRQTATVEIGCNQDDGKTIYFVRDNGAGFDMQYAGKLFGVFQRLHRTDEFEGTGVGLAIVQRIVNRHGGRIWAEAKVAQGATFYFTIENQNKL